MEGGELPCEQIIVTELRNVAHGDSDRKAFRMCLCSSCVVCQGRIRGRGESDEDEQELKHQCSGFTSVLSFLLLLCSASPEQNVFLAQTVKSSIGSVVPLIAMLICLLLSFPVFSLSACSSLTCGLQFSRDITALVRRETVRL